MSWSANFVEKPASTEPVDADFEEDASVLYLKTNGMLSDIKTSFTARREADGLIRAIKNFPMRGHEWAFTCSAANVRYVHITCTCIF